MRLLFVLLAAGLVAISPAAAERIRPLGHAYPGGGYSADVFVHRGHAYLSSYHGRTCPAQGVRVYDLSKPSRPRRVSTFASGAAQLELRGTWTEKTIVQHVATPSFTGDLAVTSLQHCPRTNSFRGFGLYDVTRPGAPRQLSLVATEPGGSHEIWLQPKGRRAYVYTAIPLAEYPGREPTPGFRIFDVTDPRQPREVGSWMAPSSMKEGKQGTFVHSVRVNATATRAYLSYWNLGTVILDISNPSQPRLLGRTTDPQGAAHSAVLTAKGRLLIETHETTGGRPSLWDVSNPRRPRLLSVFNAPARLVAAAERAGAGGFTLGVHDPKVFGRRAYFSWYALGVLVVDISRPTRPRFVAQFLPPGSRDPEGNTPSMCGRARCSNTWGVYPTKRYITASDMVGGLWVFRPPR